MRLSNKPFYLNEHTWCYEEKSGIFIIHEDFDSKGIFVKTHQIILPRKKIKNYLRRLEVK